MPLHILTPEFVEAFFAVVAIDLVLAGDNAVVIGLAAAGLERAQRGKAIAIGIVFATMLRILFALVAAQLLLVIGLLFAGGVLLLWVAWKMWRELQEGVEHNTAEALAGQDLDRDGTIAGQPRSKPTIRIGRKQPGLHQVGLHVADVLGETPKRARVGSQRLTNDGRGNVGRFELVSQWPTTGQRADVYVKLIARQPGRQQDELLFGSRAIELMMGAFDGPT